MKKLLLPLGITALIIALFFALMPKPTEEQLARQSKIGLPWQISTEAGHSTVFGITLGYSSLSQAIEILGPHYESAILAKGSDAGALELFYNDFKSGPIMGKLVVVADLQAEEVRALRANAAREEFLETGTKKVLLKPGQLELVHSFPVRSLVLAPSVRLDEAMVTQRFGKAEQVLPASETITHFLYPSRGLHIQINSKGKDLLEYVSPKAFDGLMARLPEKAWAPTAPSE